MTKAQQRSKRCQRFTPRESVAVSRAKDDVPLEDRLDNAAMPGISYDASTGFVIARMWESRGGE